MQGGFRRLPILKPSPWGEGGWPSGQTDEGTGLGIGLLYAGGFRRLRTAGYFAHGGSSSQSPLVSVSAWRRKLRPLPCSSSSRRTRCAGLRREGREISQNAPGDGSGWTLRVHVRLSPDPITRDAYLFCRCKTSGAQNLSGTLNSRRATGPWRPQNCIRCDSTSAPDFTELTGLVQNLS